MRVDVLGEVRVSAGTATVAGPGLGGRRARLALVALALADGLVTAETLAAIVWGDQPPSTWQVALRGVIRGLRAAFERIGAGGQQVIATAPSGYRLAPGVEVDVRTAGEAVRTAEQLLRDGRARAALELAGPISRTAGNQLLPGEDGAWLAAPRAAVDTAASSAADVVVAAASALGEHSRAVAAAREAVMARPLDERAHRALIGALVRAGDRAGAVRAYEGCRGVLAEQLGVDPSAETVAAYLTAIADPGGGPARARVPVATTSFVGRSAELADLVRAVAAPGAVTVTGRGGVGKSRLAAEAATGVELPGGRHWVSLASVGADELVAPTAALALGVAVGADDAEAALAAHLAPLGRCMVVLDGCEPVLDGAASLAAALLAGCPALTVLATSRTPLGVDGEVTVTLEPLPAPDPATLADEPQIRLLRDRVAAAGGTLPLDDTTGALMIALCRRCDGLPLALELAAAQLSVMAVGDLVDQLGEIDVADRLRAVVRSSYELLEDDEATVFRHLGVLDGPVGLPLVRAVVAGARVPPFRVVRILRELAARGLVTVDRTGAHWRYQQDDDLHHFARELLVADGRERETFDRLGAAIRALLPDDPRVPPGPFADDVTAVLGSVRSLFAAAVAGRADRDLALEIAFRLHRYWAWTALTEGRFWLAELLALPDESSWRRYAAFGLGYLSYFAGDTDQALRQLQAAIELFEGAPDPFVARAYIYVAGLLDDLDRSADALDYVRRSIAAAEPFGTDLSVAAAMGLGSVLSERGDPTAATYAAEAVARCRAGGSVESLSILLPTAAMVCWQVGALDEARGYVTEARPMHLGAKRIARVVMLTSSAAVALADGDLATALEDGAAAEAEAAELGVEREVPLIRCLLARAHLAAGDLAAAVECARRALDAGVAVEHAFPLALCLETAALVADVLAGAEDTLAGVLAAAAAIRAPGERPAPAPLAAPVVALARRVGASHRDPPARPEAVVLARDLLSGPR